MLWALFGTTTEGKPVSTSEQNTTSTNQVTSLGETLLSCSLYTFVWFSNILLLPLLENPALVITKGKLKRTTEFLGSVQQCQFVLLCGVFQYKPHKRLNTPEFIHGVIASLSCFLTGYQLGGKCKNTVSRLDPPLEETLYWLSVWCRVPSSCPLSSIFVLLRFFCLISWFYRFVVFPSLFLLHHFFPCSRTCWTGDVHPLPLLGRDVLLGLCQVFQQESHDVHFPLWQGLSSQVDGREDELTGRIRGYHAY